MPNSKTSEAKLAAKVAAIIKVLKANGFTLPHSLDPPAKTEEPEAEG